MTAIKKRLPDFAAIIVLILIAAVVGGYILSNQRFYLPSWVPIVGSDFFTLKAEFQTAQAVTPGQGQTVNIAGVKVGEISNVELVEGRAIVTMKIQRKYAEGQGGRPAIYNDARLLLRPKTGLKDMIVEMNTGTPGAGRVEENGTLPVANTLPDINPDEFLASLDADTRQFLVLLLGGAGEGLTDRTNDLANTFRRFEPTAYYGDQITKELVKRRTNVRRVVNNFRKLAEALGAKDDQLAELVESSNAVFSAFAAQEANIRRTLQELPSSLEQTQETLGDVETLANTLGPTLQDLRPFARALGPAQEQLRPFLIESIAPLRDQIRPFTKIATPIVADLRPAADELAALTPDLVSVFQVLNYVVNELAYNPEGSEEGYLFWASWANHAANTIFTTADAHGPIRRGLVLINCANLDVLQQVAATTPQLSVLIQLLNPPAFTEICAPSSTGATGTTRSAPKTEPKDDPSDDGLANAGEERGAPPSDESGTTPQTDGAGG